MEQLILFDIDGTLTRTQNGYIPFNEAIQKTFGICGDIRTVVPDGNTEYWVDNWVIPADAEHPVAAHKWIDFVLDPVNAGKEMNYHQYAVPVTGIKGVDPKLASDPIINVPDEKLQGYQSQVQTAKGLEQRNRAYTEFKAA